MVRIKRHSCAFSWWTGPWDIGSGGQWGQTSTIKWKIRKALHYPFPPYLLLGFTLPGTINLILEDKTDQVLSPQCLAHTGCSVNAG